MNKLLCATVGAACLIAAGCAKKVAVKPAAPPAAVQQAKTSTPDKPVISLFAASPGTIDKGGETTLRWAVEHAKNVQIAPALGSVQVSGSRGVFPAADTVYTLTATGPGGTASATASVNILVHTASRMPDQATKNQIQDLLNRIQDAYFDYDKFEIRDDGRTALTHDADLLKRIFAADPTFTVAIEGHCDERGSAEYNLGLGDRRATAAKEFLVQLGVPADRLTTISYGKDRPVCTDATEACYQRNRRAHLAPAQ